MPDSPKQPPGQVQGKSDALELAKTIPYWLVAIVGLIYASGFLVVTTHLERFGIRVEGTDVWKTRYIHIGVLAVCFPVMIVGTVVGLWYHWTILEKELVDEQEKLQAARFAVRCLRPDVPSQQYKEQRLRLRLTLMLSRFVSLSMELAFYAFVMFVRRSTSVDLSTTRLKLVAMLGAGFGFLILAGIIEKGEERQGWLVKLARWCAPISVLGLKGWAEIPYVKGRDDRPWLGMLARWCALISVLWFAGWAAYPYRSWQIWRFLWGPRGSAFFMMACFLGFIGYIVYSLKKNQAKYSPARWRASCLLAICISGPMYYLSLMGFAHSVFAYIPAERDGGDYTASWMVRISRKDGAIGGWQRLVEETSSALYVADWPGRQPCEWRSDPENPPHLHSISRDQIADIDYKYDPLSCDPEKGPE